MDFVVQWVWYLLAFVAGSAVYGAQNPAVAVEALRRRAGAASPHLML